MNVTRILFEPLAEAWLIAALLGGLALLSVLLAGRRAGWRLVLLAVIAGFLVNPVQVRETRTPLPDIAALIVDDSASMQLGDRAGLTRAVEAALEELAARDADLELARFSVSDSNGETRLFASIEAARRAIPADRLAGLIVLSDGQAHDAAASRTANTSEVPVHHIRIGNPRARDPQLRVLEAPAFGIIGDPAQFLIEVQDAGLAPGTPLTVTARYEGRAAQTFEARLGERVPVAIPITRRGTNTITFEVAGVEGELTARNNRAVVAISGVRDRLRVLLVTGKPHAGARAWRDLLKADPAVDLVHFTILREPFKRDATPIEEMSLIAFPRAELFEERLYQFDLVVFDRYQQRNVLPPLYFQRMADYVADGGAMLIAAGPDFADPIVGLHNSLLSAVIPVAPTGDVDTTPFRPQITAAGAAHPITRGLTRDITDPDWGRWFSAVGADRIDGDVLLETERGDPLLVVDRIFQGRIGIILSDHAWLWSRGVDGGGPFAELFRRTAHWLMGEPDLDEQGLFVMHEGETARVERRSLEPITDPLVVEDPAGNFTTYELRPTGPGVWEQRFPTPQAGTYNIQVGTATTVLVTGDVRTREFEDLTPTFSVLGPLVEASGGKALRVERTDDVEALQFRRVEKGRTTTGRDWAGLIDQDAYGVETVTRAPLLPGWIWVALILAAAGLSWWRESR